MLVIGCKAVVGSCFLPPSIKRRVMSWSGLWPPRESHKWFCAHMSLSYFEWRPKIKGRQSARPDLVTVSIHQEEKGGRLEDSSQSSCKCTSSFLALLVPPPKDLTHAIWLSIPDPIKFVPPLFSYLANPASNHRLVSEGEPCIFICRKLCSKYRIQGVSCASTTDSSPRYYF